MTSRKFGMFLTPQILCHAPMPNALCACVTKSPPPICLTSFLNAPLVIDRERMATYSQNIVLLAD